VNFDPQAVKQWVDETVARRDAIKAALTEKKPGISFAEPPVAFVPAETVEGLAAQGKEHGINSEASADAHTPSMLRSMTTAMRWSTNTS